MASAGGGRGGGPASPAAALPGAMHVPDAARPAAAAAAVAAAAQGGAAAQGDAAARPAEALDQRAAAPAPDRSPRRWSPVGRRSPVKASPQIPNGSGASLKAVMKLNRKVNARKRERMTVPMPREIDITLPFISDAWLDFQVMDREQQGWVEWEDAVLLVKKITKQSVKLSDLRNEVDDFDYDQTRKGLSFHLFAQWLARFQANQRREVRRTVKELFEKADSDRNGTLDREEFKGVCEKAKKLLGLTELDLDEEWGSIKKVPTTAEEVSKA